MLSPSNDSEEHKADVHEESPPIKSSPLGVKMPQNEQPTSASNSNSSTPQVAYANESVQSIEQSGAQTAPLGNSSATHVPLSAHRNPHHGHNSFYEKQRQIQQEQGVVSERESLASVVDDGDDGDDFGGEIVEKDSDQLFTTADMRPEKIEKLSRESSVSGVGSFCTQLSAESGTNSRTSNLSYVSDVNLPFDRWKEANMARLNMIPLERLLSKQVERYGVNMFDSLEPEDQLEVDTLRREQGFSFEEGVLYRYNSKRGLKLPEAGALTPNASYQPSPAQTLSPFELSAPQLSPMSMQGSTIVPVGPNMNTISPMSTQSTISTQSLPFMTPQDPVFAQPNEHTPFYLDAQEKYVSSMGEDGQIRLSIMLSEQEEKCGLNMFDAMQPADHATLHALIERGALFEDAMLQIYKIKYPMYMNPRAQPMSVAASNINLNANMSNMNLGVNPVLPLNQSNFPMNPTMPMMYPTAVPRQTMVPYLDPTTGLVVMVPTMTPQMAPQMMSVPMMQVPNMLMVPGQQMGMMPMMTPDSQYVHHQQAHRSSKSRTQHDRDHHHGHHDEHHGKHLKRPPSQRQSLSRQGSGKSHGGHHDGHHSHNSSHHSLSHHNSHSNMHMVSHSSSFQQLPSFPGSQPPSRIPSRQSMMSRSNSNASQSRRVSFSRSNSGTEATGRKTPTLEPSRQESPTRRQMEYR